MNLQWALLALGAILVLIVFAMSLFGRHRANDGKQPSPKKRKLGQARQNGDSRNEASRSEASSGLNSGTGTGSGAKAGSHSIRDPKNAPRFDQASTGLTKQEDQFDAPLFDYSEQDLGEDSATAENIFLHDENAEQAEEAGQAEQTGQAEPPRQNDERALTEAAYQEQAESFDAPAPKEFVGNEVSEPIHSEEEAEAEAEQADSPPSGPYKNLRQIDYWAKIVPASASSGLEIMAELENLIDQTPFPVQAHALSQGDLRWVSLIDNAEMQDEVHFTEIVLSCQLLNKGKACSLNALYDFDERLGVLAYGLDAEKQAVSSAEQAHEQSLKLEKIYDESYTPIAVCINATSGQAFMGKLVETSAKQQGLDFINGEYVRQKRMGVETIVLYRLKNDDLLGFSADSSADTVINRVIFSMIPALSKTPGRDAKEMLDSAKAFSSRVHGEIRIPGHQKYNQDQLLKLRDRVSKIEQQLKASGLNPGSDEAKRLAI